MSFFVIVSEIFASKLFCQCNSEMLFSFQYVRQDLLNLRTSAPKFIDHLNVFYDICYDKKRKERRQRERRKDAVDAARFIPLLIHRFSSFPNQLL